MDNVQELERLYNALSAARKRRSAIEFDTQETRFIFNAQRKIGVSNRLNVMLLTKLLKSA